jgi:hypothetical protein
MSSLFRRFKFEIMFNETQILDIAPGKEALQYFP